MMHRYKYGFGTNTGTGYDIFKKTRYGYANKKYEFSIKCKNRELNC